MAEMVQLPRLLRTLLAAPDGLAAVLNADELILRQGQGASHSFPAMAYEAAQSRGLVVWSGTMLRAQPEARAYLRRAMAEREEEGFAAQHRQEVRIEVEIAGEKQTVTRNLLESPLGHLRRLKDRTGAPFLPQEAVEAGDRLAADFERGQLQPSITSTWEPRLATRGSGQGGGKQDLSDSAMMARDRLWRAVDAIGPELAGVTLDVCCFYKGLEQVERERGWPTRSAKLMLRTALLALARHYAPPPAKPRRHQWGAEDYRPAISR
ncbi:DUF6456 domain-containing protein [Rhizobium sp. FKY42]|uniref:DUF6456 domain-containing protein n=1 Tax=Rhizobium sp. FKY42 TaxID=2562310 RepID=UPI0010BFF5CE|nr:DUF6456 domain-containing protein [Rhizobium sp. FKY42]